MLVLGLRGLQFIYLPRESQDRVAQIPDVRCKCLDDGQDGLPSSLVEVMEANGLVDGYGFWTFSDIFEERYFPSLPFHGGVGFLTLHGIPKPTYRTFEFLHDLGERQSLVDGLHETVDCSVIQKDSSVTVLLTNHTTPGHTIKTEEILIRLDHAREPIAARIRRVDEEHGGAATPGRADQRA